jgi:hypothetical protein
MSDYIKVLSPDDLSLYYVRASEVDINRYIKIVFYHFNEPYYNVFITEEGFQKMQNSVRFMPEYDYEIGDGVLN